MNVDYEFEVTESDSGNFKMKIKCPVCLKFVVPTGIPLKMKYTTDTGLNAISDGYMFMSPGAHDCNKE